MITLERAITEYLKLSRPQFAKNNPSILPIFAAAAVALSSRMWVHGVDINPGVFYIALIGEPRSGKSSFLRHYFRLFRKTDVQSIPIGSPEAMLKAINIIKHGYVWYDEVAHLAKLMDSYMGTLPTILNKAYYLDELAQIRMDQKKSAIVEAETYFMHVYFAGTPHDWVMIEKKAPGGFVRRTLIIPVSGIIPFFTKDTLTPDDERHRSVLSTLINKALKLLNLTNVTVYLPEFHQFGEDLMHLQLDNEKKSMIEEYFYKVLAGRVLANLITFEFDEDPDAWTLNDFLARIEKNGTKYGLKVEISRNVNPPVDIYIELPQALDGGDDATESAKITDFVPPNFAYVTYNTLVNLIKPRITASDEVTLRNVERIKTWLESGGDIVVSMKRFAREILHTATPQYYKDVLTILQDAGFIRIVEYPYKGRMAKYVVLDTKARICANCAHYRNPQECPLLKGVFDFKEAAAKVPPWKPACEKFEEVEE